jgi:hypothetical protein
LVPSAFEPAIWSSILNSTIRGIADGSKCRPRWLAVWPEVLILILACFSMGRVQEGGTAGISTNETILYLRTPEDRLSHLDTFLHLTKAQKIKTLSLLKRLDARVRIALDDGNNRIRNMLTEDQKAQFDELKPDTEIAPSVPLGHKAFVPIQSLQLPQQGGSPGQGASGGGSMGGQQQPGRRSGWAGPQKQAKPPMRQQ